MNMLAPFKTLVRDRCGLHLEGIAEERLRKALYHLETTYATRRGELYQRVATDERVFDALVSQLTVNETYFFREPEQLHWIASTWGPRRLEKHTSRLPLRLLSAGCSSGEEPYSLAIALCEHYGERAQQLFHIDGCDLDRQVLRKAECGQYAGLAFRTLEDPLRQRYFSPLGTRHEVVPAIRRMVSFHELNLLSTEVPEALGDYDLILFRNVSIYFTQETRRLIQQRLRRLLKPDGVLLFGITESLGNDLGIFDLHQEHDLFYFTHPGVAAQLGRLDPPDRQEPAPSPPLKKMSPAPALATPEKASPASLPPAAADTLTEIREHMGDGEPAIAERLLDARLVQDPTCTATRLLKAYLLINRKAFDEAEVLLAPILELTPWSVDALLLTGLAARWQAQPQRAEDHFKRAVYVSPECWPAHFFLAELNRLGELPGDAATTRHQATRGYAAVLRLLDAERPPSTGLEEIPVPLPPGDVRFLAARHLATLSPPTQHSSSVGGR